MHQHSKSLIFLLISVTLFSYASPVFAQTSGEGTAAATTASGTDGAPPQPPKMKIPAVVAEAIEAFNEKRYLDAARLFEKGYETAPLARVLKNAMVSWYFAGNCSEAARLAARYVVVAEPNDSVEKVVDCALDEVGVGLKQGKVKEMQHLLNVIISSAPNDAQKRRIDKYWKSLSVQEEKQERTEKLSNNSKVEREQSDTPDEKRGEEEVASAPSTPVTFYSMAPWIGTGLLAVGATAAGIGAWALKKETPSIGMGQALAGAGSVAIFGAAAFFLYWLSTDAPNADRSAEGMRLYENPAYAQNGGVSRVEFSPTLSTKEVSASLQVVF